MRILLEFVLYYYQTLYDCSGWMNILFDKMCHFYILA